jgi:hypothetical protein
MPWLLNVPRKTYVFCDCAFLCIYLYTNDNLYKYKCLSYNLCMKFLRSIGVNTFFKNFFMVLVGFLLTFTQCANSWVTLAISLMTYINFLFSYFIYIIFLVDLWDMFLKDSRNSNMITNGYVIFSLCLNLNVFYICYGQ